MFLTNIKLKKCVRAVNMCSFVIDSISNQYKTQKMCDKAVDDNPNALEFVLDQYKTQ